MNKRFTDVQILGFLCEADMGVTVRQLCTKHGFSESSYYQWRTRIVAGQPSVAQRLAELEEANVQLKQMLADAMLDVTPPRQTARRRRHGVEVGQRQSLVQVRDRAELTARTNDEPLEWPELLPWADLTGTLTH